MYRHEAGKSQAPRKIRRKHSVRKSGQVLPWLFVAAAAVVITVVVSALFSQSDQTVRVSSAADQQSAGQAVFEATTALRASLEIAIVNAGSGAVDDQVDQLNTTIRRLGDEVALRSRILSDVSGTVPITIVNWLEPIEAALADGDAGVARSLVDDLDAGVLTPLDNEAARVVEEARQVIELERSAAGQVSRFASFAVAFFIPLVVVVVLRSVSKRRQRQRDLETELHREQELSRAKDEMIGNLSHELRTPLTGIYGFAVAMEEEGYSDPGFQAEMNRMIITEAADLGRMVDDLLTAAKADGDHIAYQVEEVDVLREVQEAVQPMSRMANQVALAVAPGVVLADRLRLRQVLRNLVSNALRHGGEHVVVSGHPNEDWYHLVVSDDGAGVPEDMEQKMFERFAHEGDRALITGSVGLGLAIARLLSEGMGGELRYHRLDGVTMFEVQLPMAPTGDVPSDESKEMADSTL